MFFFSLLNSTVIESGNGYTVLWSRPVNAFGHFVVCPSWCAVALAAMVTDTDTETEADAVRWRGYNISKQQTTGSVILMAEQRVGGTLCDILMNL